MIVVIARETNGGCFFLFLCCRRRQNRKRMGGGGLERNMCVSCVCVDVCVCLFFHLLLFDFLVFGFKQFVFLSDTVRCVNSNLCFSFFLAIVILPMGSQVFLLCTESF